MGDIHGGWGWGEEERGQPAMLYWLSSLFGIRQCAWRWRSALYSTWRVPVTPKILVFRTAYAAVIKEP